MKKKTIVLIIIAIIITLLVKNKNQNMVVIPTESIRIRIISNSNDELDIEEKMKVKKNVEKEVYRLIQDANNIEEARRIINNNLEKLNIVIDDTTNYDYSVKFGNNYFPRKVYKDVLYEEGIYESLVVTLGDGNGDNWWCVLFPPLCLLDENENTSDVEYKFFVSELIDKYIR